MATVIGFPVTVGDTEVVATSEEEAEVAEPLPLAPEQPARAVAATARSTPARRLPQLAVSVFCLVIRFVRVAPPRLSNLGYIDVATVFGLWDQTSPMSLLLTIPIALWEFSLGVYLTVKGFKPCRITAEITAEMNAEVSAAGTRPTQHDVTACPATRRSD